MFPVFRECNTGNKQRGIITGLIFIKVTKTNSEIDIGKAAERFEGERAENLGNCLASCNLGHHLPTASQRMTRKRKLFHHVIFCKKEDIASYPNETDEVKIY